MVSKTKNFFFFVGALVLIMLFVVPPRSGHSTLPWLMTYYGYLEDEPGKPMTAVVTLTVSLFKKAQGGESLWTEVHKDVEVKNGFFKIMLGETTPLDQLFDEQYFVEITANNKKMPRRERLTSLTGGDPPPIAQEKAADKGNGIGTAASGGSAVIDELKTALAEALAGGEGVSFREEAGVLVVSMQSDIFFEGTSVTMRAAADDRINRLGAVFSRFPKTDIKIGVHTDTIGTYIFCKQISEQRAESLRKAFTAQGVGSARLTTIGFGEAHPIADNGFDWGRKLNRRVELFISSGS